MQRVLGAGVRCVSSRGELDQLQAEADHDHDRIALLRAKPYTFGLGSLAPRGRPRHCRWDDCAAAPAAT